eukprot:4082580-Pyramimonas_sp.AAC.1
MTTAAAPTTSALSPRSQTARTTAPRGAPRGGAEKEEGGIITEKAAQQDDEDRGSPFPCSRSALPEHVACSARRRLRGKSRRGHRT